LLPFIIIIHALFQKPADLIEAQDAHAGGEITSVLDRIRLSPFFIMYCDLKSSTLPRLSQHV